MELKGCPYCGDVAMFDFRKEENLNKEHKVITCSERYRIRCRSCCCGTFWAYYEDDAIEAWNKRAQDFEVTESAYKRGLEDGKSAWHWLNDTITCGEVSKLFGIELSDIDTNYLYKHISAEDALKKMKSRSDAESPRESIKEACQSTKCRVCPINTYFPKCGSGWHIAQDGSDEQCEAAYMLFRGAEILKRTRDI